jgi:hypothetical protein
VARGGHTAQGQALEAEAACVVAPSNTATSVGAEAVAPAGYAVALPEKLTDSEFNVYRRALPPCPPGPAHGATPGSSCPQTPCSGPWGAPRPIPTDHAPQRRRAAGPVVPPCGPC